jgi:mersacidin/lichenicidin family type 2 lantibiotic
MSDSDIIRAWKDPRFRQTFSESELANLPEHPAGTIDLTDADLSNVGKTTQFPTCTRVISEPCISC